MRYRHVKKDQFYQGLPAGDIDDDKLDAEQQAVLGAAVSAGVYERVPDPPLLKKPKKDTSDEQQPGAQN